MKSPESSSSVVTPPFPPRSMCDRVAARLRLLRFRWVGSRSYATSGRSAFVDRPFLVLGANQISLGEDVHIWPMARLEARGSGSGVVMSVGARSMIQPFVHLAAIQELSIGEECLFASHVYISDHDHYSESAHIPVRRCRTLVAAPVRIGNGVWLGERVCVLKGVTIGEGAIVGAASVVTKDIPPRSIAVGSPARVVKRWNDDTNAWERV